VAGLSAVVVVTGLGAVVVVTGLGAVVVVVGAVVVVTGLGAVVVVVGGVVVVVGVGGAEVVVVVAGGGDVVVEVGPAGEVVEVGPAGEVVVLDPPEDDPAGAPTTGTGRVVVGAVDTGDADAVGAGGGPTAGRGPVTMLLAPIVVGTAVEEADAGAPVGVACGVDPPAAVAGPGARSRCVETADGCGPDDGCSTPPPTTAPSVAPAAITTAATTPAPATLFSMAKA